MAPSLAAQIRALEQMQTSGLTEIYQALFGQPPTRRHREWLKRRIAWQLQAKELGGLAEDDLAQIRRLAAEHDPFQREALKPRKKARPTPKRQTVRPRVGTVILREYRGHTLEVAVVEDGFLYGGTLYRSLTGLAQHITGAHWNGPRFFGLRSS